MKRSTLEEIKEKLSGCQVYLEEGEYDKLLTSLEEISSTDFSDLSTQEAEEILKMLNFLIEKAQSKRQEIAGKLVNFSRFREYLR